MEGLTEGRIVHFVLPDGYSKGEHRPAIIVKVWPQMRESGTVNLLVFTDCTNDFLAGKASEGLLWATSVHYSEQPEPRTWHWIEKA